jgi:hypothetical protein
MPAPTHKLFVPKILPITPLNSKISTLVPPLPLSFQKIRGEGVDYVEVSGLAQDPRNFGIRSLP